MSIRQSLNFYMRHGIYTIPLEYLLKHNNADIFDPTHASLPSLISSALDIGLQEIYLSIHTFVQQKVMSDDMSRARPVTPRVVYAYHYLKQTLNVSS